MKPLIVVEGVSKSYHLDRTEIRALANLNICIEAGEFTALAGPSGSGKTTLLNIIGCIDKPDCGRLMLDGIDVTERSLNSLATVRRDRLGYIFQSFNLIPVLTAYENVEYPLLLTAMNSSERRKRVMTLLDRVGLGTKSKKQTGPAFGRRAPEGGRCSCTGFRTGGSACRRTDSKPRFGYKQRDPRFDAGT